MFVQPQFSTKSAEAVAKTIGGVVVIALLAQPAAVAGELTKRLWHMMALSSALTVFFTTTGLAVSYGPDLPAGATTIIIAGIVYLLVVSGMRLFKMRR